MDKFSTYIDSLSARHGRSKVFDDFLTIVICCLSMGKKEDLYFKTIKAYNKDELNIIVQAFAALVVEMDDDGKGLKDVLGVYFEEYFYNQKLGQFFTPPSICKLMTDIIPAKGQDVHDPCCGSGRFFLSVAGNNRNVTFYGADISEVCCKMTLINMCLNGLKCRISCMNSLTLEKFKEWAVVIQKFTNCPYIVEIEEQNKTEATPAVEIIPTKEKEIKQITYRRFSA